MNFFENIDINKNKEIVDIIHNKNNVRIERIISTGQISPDNFWYDQDENEWLILLDGEAEIEYIDNSTIFLQKGDYLLIPAHKKHRVKYTEIDTNTIWLAIFFN